MMSIQDWDINELTEFFIYLDELRDSGTTNMFGAGRYLCDDFDLEKTDARIVLTAWMKAFSGDPVEERATQAQAQ